MSMDVEEMIRAQPMDAVVLILVVATRPVPAQLMGAAAADLPTLQLQLVDLRCGGERRQQLLFRRFRRFFPYRATG